MHAGIRRAVVVIAAGIAVTALASTPASAAAGPADGLPIGGVGSLLDPSVVTANPLSLVTGILDGSTTLAGV
ncbi:hypothetical protein G5C51_25760 [Streptomyces sp. A7024]|uniref:Secreted protein n=1 Tax=Streptomyces coryli TaxID=1128680 RepID=A0A6G4U4Y0_9ACTN|nr:hypothetical protein [Streptomyces coryli]NGN67299.1 hypothetical protein [Streptomyces coryli]